MQQASDKTCVNCGDVAEPWGNMTVKYSGCTMMYSVVMVNWQDKKRIDAIVCQSQTTKVGNAVPHFILIKRLTKP